MIVTHERKHHKALFGAHRFQVKHRLALRRTQHNHVWKLRSELVAISAGITNVGGKQRLEPVHKLWRKHLLVVLGHQRVRLVVMHPFDDTFEHRRRKRNPVAITASPDNIPGTCVDINMQSLRKTLIALHDLAVFSTRDCLQLIFTATVTILQLRVMSTATFDADWLPAQVRFAWTSTMTFLHTPMAAFQLYSTRLSASNILRADSFFVFFTCASVTSANTEMDTTQQRAMTRITAASRVHMTRQVMYRASVRWTWLTTQTIAWLALARVTFCRA
mmetsp:Transcript_24261/g.39034  ORF Transcript_24261/g.39034 Transcript_24261/m.39034 type:complete len:275 (+) Transcript_24261:692-1516(+)